MKDDDKPIGFGDEGVKGSAKKFLTIFLISIMGVLLFLYKIFKSNTGKKSNKDER